MSGEWIQHKQMQNLLDMDLHGTITIGSYEILRVPGGWMYTRFDCSETRHSETVVRLSSTFVPQPTEEKK